jgi:hypothetical protein
MTRFALHGLAALAAVVFLGGCGTSGADDHTSAPRTAPAPLHGEAARAAQAVTGLADALRDGDVERLCKPGAVFTRPVVAAIEEDGLSCEESLELSPEVRRPPALTVTKLAFEPGLATAQVKVGRGASVPLDIVRSGRRWLVSFSGSDNPVAALRQAMPEVHG